MRIGFDAKRYLYNNTGLGNYSRELVNAYAKSFPEDRIFLISEKPEDANRKHELPNVKFVAPKRNTPFFRVWHCYKLINALKLDIYHGLSNEIPLSYGKITAKLVCTIHDVIFKYYPGYYKVWDRYIYNKKTKNALANSDLIISTSDTTKQDLKKFYTPVEAPTQTIYQSINPSYLLKGNKIAFENRKTFVYVSSFTKRKNHQTLIEAFNLIKNQTQKKLILIGQDGSELEMVKNAIKQYDLENRVEVHVNAESAFIKKSLEEAVAFIYPSFYEGFGIPLIEAARLKTPIAASNISIFKEIGENSLLYFHPNKPEEIADAMLQMEDKDFNHELTQKLPSLSKKCDPDIASKALHKAYCTLLGTKDHTS